MTRPTIPWPDLETEIEAQMNRPAKKPSRLKNLAISALCVCIMVFTGLGILLASIFVGPVKAVFWMFEGKGRKSGE